MRTNHALRFLPLEKNGGAPAGGKRRLTLDFKLQQLQEQRYPLFPKHVMFQCSDLVRFYHCLRIQRLTWVWLMTSRCPTPLALQGKLNEELKGLVICKLNEEVKGLVI